MVHYEEGGEERGVDNGCEEGDWSRRKRQRVGHAWGIGSACLVVDVDVDVDINVDVKTCRRERGVFPTSLRISRPKP